MSRKYSEVLAINEKKNRQNKEKNNIFPKALKINKMSLYSAERIANEFNSFFANVGPSLAKNILPVSTGFTEHLMSFNDTISDSDLTTEEFETAFKSLKSNKAAGNRHH